MVEKVNVYESPFGQIPVMDVVFKKDKIVKYYSHCGCDDKSCCPADTWRVEQVIDKIQITDTLWVTEDQLCDLAEIFATAGFRG